MLRSLRRVYLVVLLAVAVGVLLSHRSDVAQLVRGSRPHLLALCLLMTAGQLALTSAVWTSGLRALGAPVAWRTTLAATAVSAPARYLPGGIWYAVGRGAVLRAHGVPVRALGAVAALETLLVPVVGFALGGLLLALAGPSAGPRLPTWLAGAAVVLLALATPPVVNAALRVRPPKDDAGRPTTPVRLSWAALGRVLVWVVAFWCWAAATFTVYVAAFPGATDEGVLVVAGAYMVAWGIGWLAVLAPQGTGVFELALATLISSGRLEVELALVLAGFRGLVLVRDLVAAGTAGVLQRRR